MALGWKKHYSRYSEFFLNTLFVYGQRKDIKMFLEILLSLATISFFSIFALKPTLVTIAGLYREIKQKEELVNNLNQKIKNLRAGQEEFRRESARIPLIEGAIPDNPSPETLIKQIEGTSQKDSVSLAGISIGAATLVGSETVKGEDNNLEKLPEDVLGIITSVRTMGPYSSLFSFISDLERLRRPMKIDSATLNTAVNETGKINLVITGRSPYLKKENQK